MDGKPLTMPRLQAKRPWMTWWTRSTGISFLAEGGSLMDPLGIQEIVGEWMVISTKKWNNWMV